LYVRGRYVYQSNYTAGLRVLDASDPANPKETAYFDTYPQDDGGGFRGTWSNYPYFKSGLIAVASMREGLYILRHRTDESR
jgi:choice-of-anchor B domain-containing protein